MITVAVFLKDLSAVKFDVKDFSYCSIDYEKKIWKFNDANGTHREYRFDKVDKMRFIEL